MSKFHRLRLTSQQIGSTHGTKILLDEHELRGVRFIRLTGELNDVWRCEIEFLPGALDVDLAGVLTSGHVLPPPVQVDSIDVTALDEEHRMKPGVLPGALDPGPEPST